MDSVATLNWYDSGQLASAFNYKHFIGVIGPNENHFKYLNVNKKDFTTLIHVQVLHHENHIDLSKSTSIYGHDIVKKIELPLFRGDQKYGIIRILSLEKFNSKV